MSHFINVWLDTGGTVFLNLDDVIRVEKIRTREPEKKTWSTQYIIKLREPMGGKATICARRVYRVDINCKQDGWMARPSSAAAISAPPGQTVHQAYYDDTEGCECFRYEKAPLLAWVVDPSSPESPRPVAYGLDLDFSGSDGEPARDRFAIESESGVLTAPDGTTFPSVDEWLSIIRKDMRVKADADDYSSDEPVHTEGSIRVLRKRKGSLMPQTLQPNKDKVVDGKDLTDL